MLPRIAAAVIAAALLLPGAAHAQSLGQQVDAAVSSVTRAAAGLANQIAMDQSRIEQLTQQLQAITAERDRMAADAKKAATDPPK